MKSVVAVFIPELRKIIYKKKGPKKHNLKVKNDQLLGSYKASNQHFHGQTSDFCTFSPNFTDHFLFIE